MKFFFLVRNFVLAGAAAVLFTTPMMAAPKGENGRLLWYKQPAEKWVEALPVANGRSGAMIFGQPKDERLQLNDVTIWSGGPQPDADRKDAYKSLLELCQLNEDRNLPNSTETYEKSRSFRR